MWAVDCTVYIILCGLFTALYILCGLLTILYIYVGCLLYCTCIHTCMWAVDCTVHMYYYICGLLTVLYIYIYIYIYIYVCACVWGLLTVLNLHIPPGESRLREVFLKVGNDIRGRYYAELIKVN